MLEPVMGPMHTRLLVAVALVLGFFSCTSRWDEDVAGEIRARLTGATTAEGVVFPVSGDLHAPDSLRAFYKDRKFRPLWITRDGASTPALTLFTTLESAEADGLAPEDLHLQALNRLFAEPEARSRAARLDILLTDGLIVYANELVNGRIDPVSIDAECLRTPEPLDVQLILNRIAGGENMADLLASLAPADPGYALLRKAHRRYLGIAASGGWPELPPDKAVAPSDDPRAALLPERLQAEGYLSEGDELEDALREFQRSHGLRDDGVLNEATLAALNVPAAARAEQITLNLERWRWLPRELGMPRVVVNIAGFSLDALAPEEEPLTMRTIVGLAQRRTPVMSSEINTLVLNPTWGIPPTILKEDLLPKLKADPSYLTRHETRVFDIAIGAEVDPTSIAWEELDPDSIPYVLRQDGGPSNPLGQIKFLFPNPFDVYLHDTPAGSLFGPRVRAFSSGCIRVEKAMELGAFLLRATGKKNTRPLEEWLAKAKEDGRELALHLPETVPIHVVYWTAWVDRDGRLQFREDVYERDARLREALRRALPCTY